MHDTSKSFFDPSTQRQILFGWVVEERSVDAHGAPYGWAGCQSLPRTIVLADDGVTVLTQPIAELQSLATPVVTQTDVVVAPGMTTTVVAGQQGGIGGQIQILATIRVTANAQVCGNGAVVWCTCARGMWRLDLDTLVPARCSFTPSAPIPLSLSLPCCPPLPADMWYPSAQLKQLRGIHCRGRDVQRQ